MVRPAVPHDVPTILELIHELARYEGEPAAVEASADDLATALFSDAPQVFAHVATLNGRVVGAAVWFVTFSTWTGRHGIHLVDLIVDPRARGGGHGRDLLRELARICVERGYRRLDWEVMDALEHGAGDRGPLELLPTAGWHTARRVDAVAARRSGPCARGPRQRGPRQRGRRQRGRR